MSGRIGGVKGSQRGACAVPGWIGRKFCGQEKRYEQKRKAGVSVAWKGKREDQVVGIEDLTECGGGKVRTHWSPYKWAWKAGPGLNCASGGPLVPRHCGFRNFSPS